MDIFPLGRRRSCQHVRSTAARLGLEGVLPRVEAIDGPENQLYSPQLGPLPISFLLEGPGSWLALRNPIGVLAQREISERDFRLMGCAPMFLHLITKILSPCVLVLLPLSQFTILFCLEEGKQEPPKGDPFYYLNTGRNFLLTY